MFDKSKYIDELLAAAQRKAFGPLPHLEKKLRSFEGDRADYLRLELFCNGPLTLGQMAERWGRYKGCYDPVELRKVRKHIKKWVRVRAGAGELMAVGTADDGHDSKLWTLGGPDYR